MSNTNVNTYTMSNISGETMTNKKTNMAAIKIPAGAAAEVVAKNVNKDERDVSLNVNTYTETEAEE